MARGDRTGWLTLVVLAAVSGCGNPDAPKVTGSLEEATVTGIVRVRGKPVTNGRIGFKAANINRPNVALREVEIAKDGRFTIKALVGDNSVDVICKELGTAKNRRLIENEQTIRVRSGENSIDVDIPRKARPVDPLDGSG
jgi:hypothetical protein